MEAFLGAAAHLWLSKKKDENEAGLRSARVEARRIWTGRRACRVLAAQLRQTYPDKEDPMPFMRPGDTSRCCCVVDEGSSGLEGAEPMVDVVVRGG